jgi:hypothetical protein
MSQYWVNLSSALQRKRSQLQPDNPAFCATLQGGDGFVREIQPHRFLQKCAGFCQR